MKVSQLLHEIDKDELVMIDDLDRNGDDITIYAGAVKGIKKDDPINKMHVEGIAAVGDTIMILAQKTKK